MTLTEKEMLIAKIAIMQGLVVCKRITPEEATEKLRVYCDQHYISFEVGLQLEAEIDQMFGDDTKR